MKRTKIDVVEETFSSRLSKKHKEKVQLTQLPKSKRVKSLNGDHL